MSHHSRPHQYYDYDLQAPAPPQPPSSSYLSASTPSRTSSSHFSRTSSPSYTGCIHPPPPAGPPPPYPSSRYDYHTNTNNYQSGEYGGNRKRSKFSDYPPPPPSLAPPNSSYYPRSQSRNECYNQHNYHDPSSGNYHDAYVNSRTSQWSYQTERCGQDNYKHDNSSSLSRRLSEPLKQSRFPAERREESTNYFPKGDYSPNNETPKYYSEGFHQNQNERSKEDIFTSNSSPKYVESSRNTNYRSFNNFEGDYDDYSDKWENSRGRRGEGGYKNSGYPQNKFESISGDYRFGETKNYSYSDVGRSAGSRSPSRSDYRNERHPHDDPHSKAERNFLDTSRNSFSNSNHSNSKRKSTEGLGSSSPVPSPIVTSPLQSSAPRQQQPQSQPLTAISAPPTLNSVSTEFKESLQRIDSTFNNFLQVQMLLLDYSFSSSMLRLGLPYSKKTPDSIILAPPIESKGSEYRVYSRRYSKYK